MLRNVFAKTLWDQRRGLLIWAIGLAAVGVAYAAFWPSFNTPELAGFMEAYPRAVLDALGFTDITTAAGYLGSTTYGILGPILIIIYAAVLGGRAVAGEEEAGRLEVLLAHPVGRWQVILERWLAMVVSLAVVGAVLLLAMVVITGVLSFEGIDAARQAAATLQMVLLGLVFGSLALAVGAATGRRGLALGSVAALGVLTYFANTLGPSVDAIAWTRDLSPFRYYSGGQPLLHGLQLADAGVLLAASAALLGLGGMALQRRDIGV
jgi:ABC-2 type transport system permease protein